MNILPLTGAIGAEISGVDLSHPDTVPWDVLRPAWLRHRVLFFRGQQLSPAQLVAFARPLGTLTPAHPLLPGHPEAPEVLVLDSGAYELGVGRREAKTSYNNQWHTDVTFAACPPAGTALLAVQLPPLGGDTIWADLIAAYEHLSEPMKRYLEGLSAWHDAARAFGRTVNTDQAAREERLRRNPPVLHPMVRVHPETGERGLFVNPTFTERIEGVSPEESSAVLGYLHAFVPSPDWSVRWRWAVGDVALWDNRSTTHFATADYGSARRVMHRVTLAGDVPRGTDRVQTPK